MHERKMHRIKGKTDKFMIVVGGFDALIS
jgi:hypothetical protein